MSKEMIKALTPQEIKPLTSQEALQALLEGKQVEVYSEIQKAWWKLDPNNAYLNVLLDKRIKFRLVQEKIVINNQSFPKPYQGEMKIGQYYYIPKLVNEKGYEAIVWEDNDFDEMAMDKNMVHLFKENAIAHANALIALSKGDK